MITARALLLLLVALPCVAQAQPRYTRPGSQPPPPSSTSPARRGSPPPATPAKPTVPPDTILKIQGKALPIRRGQIEILDDLIADCVASQCDADDLADLYFRKAELYALEQRYFKLRTQELAIAADVAKTKAQKAKLENESAALAEKTKTSLLAAVKVYQAMAADTRFKNYPNMPKALFYFGYMLGAGGYRKDMRDVYDRLLKDYPSSPYVPEAHLAFADYHFEKGELADAE